MHQKVLIALCRKSNPLYPNGQSKSVYPRFYSFIQMLRILARTTARSSRILPVASSTRCIYAQSRSFLRTTTTVAAETPKPDAVNELAIISSKDMPQIDPELVDPVLRWLLDEQNTLEAPHIPVKGVNYLPVASRRSAYYFTL